MTKIEWCDATWNPVWGCLRGCPYCYARKMAKRFARKMAIKNKLSEYNGFDHNFQPTWLESNFQKKFPKKPSRIFVNSMSDICYWKPDWMNRVLEKIKEYPQHTFLFLTKQPSTYYKYLKWFSINCWIGFTITNQQQMDNVRTFIDSIYLGNKKIFYSIEPIQEEIKLYANPDWSIIGTESGNRKNKIISDYYWIYDIYRYCCSHKIPIFMKDNLRDIWPTKLIQEFPE